MVILYGSIVLFAGWASFPCCISLRERQGSLESTSIAELFSEELMTWLPCTEQTFPYHALLLITFFSALPLEGPTGPPNPFLSSSTTEAASICVSFSQARAIISLNGLQAVVCHTWIVRTTQQTSVFSLPWPTSGYCQSFRLQSEDTKVEVQNRQWRERQEVLRSQKEIRWNC